MSDAPPTFLDRVLAGTARAEDIDDAVDDWHDGDHAGPLHAFLGMTPDEYATWLKQPDSLSRILRHRRAALSPPSPAE